MSVIETIRDKLEELASDKAIPMEGVWYGACRQRDLKTWNYFVFDRWKTRKASNRMDIETFYEVHIVHENYIPEGYVDKVINELLGATEAKIRMAAEDIVYNYTFKGNTDMVVEIATIIFFHPEKRC